MRLFIILLTLNSSLSSLAQDRDIGPRNINVSTRINRPKDPNARCMSTRGISANYCEMRRKKALESGCITKNEYQDLIRFGSTPSCDQYLALEKINSKRRAQGLADKSFKQLTTNEKLHQLITWCPCGCFHPGSKISVVIKDHLQIRKAGTVANYADKYELLHLREDSKRDYFTYASSPIRISTKGKESKPLVHIYLSKNKLLRLTENHPVLLKNMKMIFAKDLKKGMFLLSQEGSPLEVLKIEKKMFKGNVVNFVVESSTDNPLEHIIFSDGVAVGDMYWQSKLEHEVDRIKARL